MLTRAEAIERKEALAAARAYTPDERHELIAARALRDATHSAMDEADAAWWTARRKGGPIAGAESAFREAEDAYSVAFRALGAIEVRIDQSRQARVRVVKAGHQAIDDARTAAAIVSAPPVRHRVFDAASEPGARTV